MLAMTHVFFEMDLSHCGQAQYILQLMFLQNLLQCIMLDSQFFILFLLVSTTLLSMKCLDFLFVKKSYLYPLCYLCYPSCQSLRICEAQCPTVTLFQDIWAIRTYIITISRFFVVGECVFSVYSLHCSCVCMFRNAKFCQF